MQKERVSVQKQTSFWDYRLTYAPFRFLEDPSVQPFHLAPNTPESGDIGELHYHDGLELGLCLSGSGVFIIDGDPLPFSAPCATILYPEQFHKARSGLQPSQWYFATFCPELLLSDLGAKASRELFSPKSVPPSLSIFGADTVPYLLIHQIITEMLERPPLFLECIRGLLQSLIITHSRMLTGSDPMPRRDRSRIGPVVSYISQHFREDLTIPVIAREFHITETTLRRWFWDAMEVTPLEYLHKVRLTAACSLLQTGELPVLEAALAVGYNSLSSFHRQFRRIYDCSPTEYLRRTAPSEAS